MNIPTPKDMPQHKPVAKIDNLEVSEATKTEPEKRVFVRKPHLTDRPFKNLPGLVALKTNLEFGEAAKAGTGNKVDSRSRSRSNGVPKGAFSKYPTQK